MSRGTPITPLRMPEGLKQRILAALAKREAGQLADGMTLTDFVLVACREKLDKWDRSSVRSVGDVTWIELNTDRVKRSDQS